VADNLYTSHIICIQICVDIDMLQQDSRGHCALDDESVTSVVNALLLYESVTPVVHQRHRRRSIVDPKCDGISEVTIYCSVLWVLVMKAVIAKMAPLEDPGGNLMEVVASLLLDNITRQVVHQLVVLPPGLHRFCHRWRRICRWPESGRGHAPAGSPCVRNPRAFTQSSELAWVIVQA
jgi:hypothetical protein